VAAVHPPLCKLKKKYIYFSFFFVFFFLHLSPIRLSDSSRHRNNSELKYENYIVQKKNNSCFDSGGATVSFLQNGSWDVRSERLRIIDLKRLLFPSPLNSVFVFLMSTSFSMPRPRFNGE
jgi:hypothetical protein